MMFATVGYPPHHVAPLAHAGAPLDAVGAQQVVLGLPPPLKLGDGLPPPCRYHHHHYHYHGQCRHVDCSMSFLSHSTFLNM